MNAGSTSVSPAGRVDARYACVSVITTPAYVLGALVLGHSIRKSGWPHDLLILVTRDVGAADRERLLRIWDRVAEVEPIANPNPPEGQAFASFATTYTKLRIWEQTDYDKLIYLDADTLVLRDLQELLDRPGFAAAPCGTAPDQFNSGVLVLTPSRDIFSDMLQKLPVLRSYDGGDQGFLNEYFADWYTGPASQRLPLTCNVPRLLAYYASAWRRLDGQIKVIHFYGPQKPWDLKDGWWHKVLSRLITRFTALELVEPAPRTLWWAMHHEMRACLSEPASNANTPNVLEEPS